MEGFERRENAPTYDREAVAAEAMEQARSLLAERGLNELDVHEHTESVINLMKELSGDNANRHLVEALARILTIETERAKLQEEQSQVEALAAQYGYAA